MSTPALPRPSAVAPRVPWFTLVLLACGLLALAGAVFQRNTLSLAAAVLLLLAWLPRAWRHRSFAVGVAWIALAVLLLAPIASGHPEWAWMALPVVCFAAVAWLFARTLRRGREPLVTRCVRLIEGEQRVALPGVAAYTRGVTVFWAWLLAMLALVSLAVALFAGPGGWLALAGVQPPITLPESVLAWYPDVGCWLVLVAAFAGEYVFRRWRLPDVPQSPPGRFVAEMARRWPELVRGDDRSP